MRTSGSPAIRITGFPGIPISAYPGIQLSGYPDILLSCFPDMWQFSDFRISGHPDSRISRYLRRLPDIRNSGDPEVQVSPDIRISGYPEHLHWVGQPRTHIGAYCNAQQCGEHRRSRVQSTPEHSISVPWLRKPTCDIDNTCHMDRIKNQRRGRTYVSASWRDASHNTSAGMVVLANADGLTRRGMQAIEKTRETMAGHLWVVPSGRSTHFFNADMTMQSLEWVSFLIRRKRQQLHDDLGVHSPFAK